MNFKTFFGTRLGALFMILPTIIAEVPKIIANPSDGDAWQKFGIGIGMALAALGIRRRQIEGSGGGQ